MVRVWYTYTTVVCMTQLLLSGFPVRADNIAVSGDVYIEALFSTYKSDNGQCGAVDPFSVQLQEGVKWALGKLNTKQYGETGDTYIPGMKIGLRSHDTCRSPDLAKEITYNISRQLDGTRSNTVAILGPEYSSEAQQVSRLVSSLPDPAQLLQVGFITTATSLSDHSTYTNFYRTIPTDDIQTRTMRKFMSELKWTYVAIIYDDDTYGNEAVSQLCNQSVMTNTCFPVKVPVNISLPEEAAKTFLKEKLMSMHNRDIRIGGIVVIGSRNLGTYVMETIYRLNQDNIYTIPVILGSEGIDFIGGTHSYLSNTTRGMYISSPPRQYIQEFNEHWISIMTTNVSYVETNPALSAVYEYVTGCKPAGNNGCAAMTREQIEDNLPQSYIVQYAVQAVLVIAKAIKSVHSNVCDGVSGACSSLIDEPKSSFIKQMNDLKVNFDNDFNPWRIKEFRDSHLTIKFPSGSGDAVVLESEISTYDVYNRRTCSDVPGDTGFCLKKVLEYFQLHDEYAMHLDTIRDYDHATQTETTDIRRPQCPSGKDCVECSSATIPGVDVVEGDMYVVGICPIHGTSDTPLSCGIGKRGGLDIAEAIKFEVRAAVEDMKHEFPDANIGTIIIDSCWDPQIIAERVLNVHKQGVLINGSYVDVKYKILGYIGSWMSDISIKVAELLTRLGYVQISYGSTSPLLSNRELYPYFMRVVYSDIEQAKEMLNTVKKVGSSSVQILYSESAYGIGGKNALLKHAKSYNICVSNSIGVPVSDLDFAKIKDDITKEGRSKVVMVFLSSLKLEQLLPTLNTLIGYLMIGSEAWGTRDILKSVTNLNNSITFANELPINNIFEKHFRSLSPALSTSPWLEEYMELYYDCYFEWSFKKASRSRQCTPATTFGDSNYKIETWVPFAATALKALLKGARLTLDDVCNTSTSICPEYYSHQHTLVDNIRKQRVDYYRLFSLMDVFDDNSDGLIPYNKYQIVIRNGIASYQKMESSWRWPHSVYTCIGGNSDVCNDLCSPASTARLETAQEDHQLGLKVSLAVFVVLTVGLIAGIILTVWAYRRNRWCFKYVEHGSRYLTTYHDTDQGYGSDGRNGPAAPPNIYVPPADGNDPPIPHEVEDNV